MAQGKKLLNNDSVQILLREINTITTPPQTLNPAKALPNATIEWKIFTLENPTQERQEAILRIGDRFINFAELYWQDSTGKWQEARSGAYLPFSAKQVPTNQGSFFIVQLSKKENKTFYLRISNIDSKPLKVQPALFSPIELERQIAHRNLTQGVFLGMVAIMIGYNFLVFLISKDKPYLFYTFYMLANWLYFFNYYGLQAELFLGEFPTVYLDVWLLSTGSLSIFYLLFIRSYLNTTKVLPMLDKYMRWWFVIRLGEILFAFLWLKITFNYNFLHDFHRNFGILESFVFLFFLIRMAQANTKIMYYLWIGTLFLYLGQALSIIFAQYDGNYIFQVGIVLEILVFSIGLGYRMRQNEKVKRQAQLELIEQLQLNEELQVRAKEELEDKVIQRTAEITAQMSLIDEQRQKFRNLSQHKDHILSVISHDIRNPLNSIKGILNLVKRDYLSKEEIQEYAEKLYQRTESVEKLLEELTSWAKIQREGLSVNLYPVKPFEVAESVLQLIKNTQNKNITFENHIHPTAEVYADEDMLRIVLRNLVGNAYKFTHKNGRVTLWSREEKESYTFAITDNGIGIPVEKQAKLLKNMEIKRSKGTDNEAGTGLGLLLCKDFLERMNSFITFESTLGKGTTFFFTLKKVNP